MMKNTINNRKRTMTATMFLLPALALYLCFVIWPIIYTTFLSFTNWDGISATKNINGFKNYDFLFGKADFLLTLKNSLKLTGWSIVLQISIGLTIAYLLFRTKNKIFKFYRAIYFLPVVIASTAIGTMFKILLNNDIGVFSSILEFFGLGALSRPWLSDTSTVIYTVIFVQVWQYIGTYIIIFLAAMQSIDSAIFESAVIDGANSLQQFTRITVPLISSNIKVALVLCFTGSMKSFDIPFVMTSGGPGYSSSYLANYMYKTVFSSNKFGRGSAVAIVILLISLSFTLLFNYVTREREVKGGKI